VEDYEVTIVEPIEDVKMHWPQWPDLGVTGMDVDMSALSQIVLADDWECTETGPVTDIHFWVSFWHDILPSQGVGGLDIAINIHADNPGPPYSTPGVYLWYQVFYPGQYNVHQVADDRAEDWYNPLTGMWLDDNHLQVYQYDFFIYEDFFIQDSGTIYWLEVADFSEPYDPLIGWKTTERDLHFMDDACYWDGMEWTPMFYPPGHEYEGETIDLAFVITGGPLPKCGDVNNDSVVDVGDIVYLVSYLYRGSSAPLPQSCKGDVNNDDIVNVGDVVFLVSFLYRGGPAPNPNCCNPPWAAE
jgi:hypothetical protein